MVDIKRTPPGGSRISSHELAAEGDRIRRIEEDVRSLQVLREADRLQHQADMQAAMAVFKANTTAVEANTKAVEDYSTKIQPLVTARADFLVVKKWLTIGAALIASMFAAILGAWKLLDRYRGK